MSRRTKSERNRYNEYLCSREWNVLKEAVKQRSGGICERCKTNPGEAVHHLTYERKYNEELEDLQHLCNPCHEFISGKSDHDPLNTVEIPEKLRLYIRLCSHEKLHPVPLELIYELSTCRAQTRVVLELLNAIYQTEEAIRRTACDGAVVQHVIHESYDIAILICRNKLGFHWPRSSWRHYIKAIDPGEYERACVSMSMNCRIEECHLQDSECDDAEDDSA